jgi:hypothetical protein
MDSTVSFDVNTTIGAHIYDASSPRTLTHRLPCFAGVLQIGVLISYALFGVTTTQTYIYYSRFPDDSLKLKALVCATTQRRGQADSHDAQVAFVW